MLAQHRAENSIASFRQTVAEATKIRVELTMLRKQADGGDAKAAQQLFAKQVELAHLKPAEAWTQLAQLRFPDEEQATLTGLIAKAEVGQLLGEVDHDVRSQVAAGEKAAMMLAKGHVPAESRELFYFWGLTFRFAESKGDVDLLEKCRAGAKRMRSPDPTLLQGIEAALAKLSRRKDHE